MRELPFPVDKGDQAAGRPWTCEHSDTCTRKEPCNVHRGKRCSIEGCDRAHQARGWCFPHWKRWSRHGDPLGGRPDRSTTEHDRLWSKVNKTDTCWLWTAATEKGYGLYRHDGRLSKAHRVVYELLVGPVPTGLDLDHLCRVRNCVNPAHLEPVTRAVNLRRGAEARRAA